MSKYDRLWNYIKTERPSALLFSEVKDICGISIDHTLLGYKKDLEKYGFRVCDISLKKQKIYFEELVK